MLWEVTGCVVTLPLPLLLCHFFSRLFLVGPYKYCRGAAMKNRMEEKMEN